MGKHRIKVVAYVGAPYVYPCFTDYGTEDTEKCPRPGFEIEILYDQLVRLGFIVDFMKAENDTDMLDILEHGYADVSASADVTNIYERENLSFSMPLVTDKTVFLIQDPKFSEVPNLFLYKWHWSVWVLSLLLFIIVYTYKKAIRQNCHKKTSNSLKAKSSYPMTFWSIAFGIILSVYAQNLALAVFKKSVVFPFDNIDTLYKQLKDGKCRFVIYKYKLQSTLKMFPFLYQKQDYFRTFDKALQNDALILSGDFNETDIVRHINNHTCNIGVIDYLPSLILLTNVDGMAIIDLPEIPTFTYSNYFSKSFPFKRRLQLLNAGSISTFYEYQVKRYATFLASKLNGRITPKSLVDQSVHAIHLYQVLDIFYFLFAGIALSFFTFVSLKVLKNLCIHMIAN